MPHVDRDYTRIPNAIIDDPTICSRDKLVLCALIRHAYGKKVEVYPSQLRLTRLLGMNVKTVRAALKSLVRLDYITPRGHGRPGARETYRLNLSDRRVSTRPAAGQPPVQPVPSNNNKQENQWKKTPVATTDIGGTGEPDTSTMDPFGDALLYEGSVRSADRITKAQVNELKLTPLGFRVSGDYDDLDYDLNALWLPALGGNHLGKDALDKLVSLRGVEFCQLWAAWLPRKVAAEYARGRPVRSPAGLYRRAVEQGWEVDPSWPEFDDSKHRFRGDKVTDDLEIPF